jgi:hypothetical protein
MNRTLRRQGRLRTGRLCVAAAAALMTLGVYPSTAIADDTNDRLAHLERLLEKSLAKIDALEARIRELEAQRQAGNAAAAAAASPVTVPQAAVTPDANERIETLQRQVDALNQASAARHGDDSSLPIHGFADINAGNHNQNFPAEKGFNIAELDFYLTPQLGTHTRALFELNFETDQGGDLGVDLERAQVGYQFNDAATLWFGRFHTPYGYYNTAYHHGRWLMTDIRRPRFIEFEDHGGAMPAHTVGAWITGGIPAAGGKLTYDAYFGNGQRILDTGSGQGAIDMNNIGNTHGNMIYGGRLGFAFGGALDGLLIGVDAFSTKIADDQPIPALTGVRSYGTYLVYDSDKWEFISELHLFDNRDLSGTTGVHHSEAGFADLAYRMGRFAPYLRWERASFQQADQYFAQLQFGNSYWRGALGLRFDIDQRSVVKLEGAHTTNTDRLRDQFNDALIQYAIRF